jgi:hypothetical protein
LCRLSTLILNSNQLTCITFESPGCGFLKLQSLSLNQNLIRSWRSINTLSLLSALKYLRVKQNPIVETEKPFEARQQVIARIPQLTSLEGSEVSIKERHLAECYYLKRYASEWVAAGASTENSSSQQAREFHFSHPLYSALVRGWCLSVYCHILSFIADLCGHYYQVIFRCVFFLYSFLLLHQHSDWLVTTTLYISCILGIHQ